VDRSLVVPEQEARAAVVVILAAVAIPVVAAMATQAAA
jgi:hypothetical protein